MSVVVWDGKVLAADRQATASNLIRTTTKIWRSGDTMIAGAGNATAIQAMKDWILNLECDPEQFPKLREYGHDDVTIWVINRNGTLLRFEETPWPLHYHDQTFAEGSGRDFAYGALAMGADAVTAVKVASDYDVFCGRGVDVLSFDD